MDQIINDFGNLALEAEHNRSDAVFFAIDAYDLLPHNPEKLVRVLDLYINFLKSKVVGNPKDKTGLIVYGIVTNW